MRYSRALSRAGSLLAACCIVLSLAFVRSAWAGAEIRWEPTQKPLTQTLQAPRETSLTTEFTLFNDAASSATYTISFPDLPGGWSARTGTPSPITIENGKSVKIAIRLDIPDNATAGRRTITIRATRTSTTPNLVEDAFLDLTLVAQNPAPTAEGVCPEPKDPGGDIGSASLIRVDKDEGHGICTTGDEDWFKFGAVGGKYYTIDILTMDKGLDLAMELYDENERLIDANDDFPRDDNPASTRPRIQSFRAPVSGYYYFRVRDTLGIGGANLGYRVVVLGESYGADPPPVASICNDRYEPDGLPEIAYKINPNETHKAHRLCPTGDADWVKFFALAGYTYHIYTNSRPYAPEGSNGVAPGMDTILFVFNRDGQTLIDFNNNIVGGTTLDSAVSFRPAADGTYYIQVKNVGDIGDMDLAYDLTVKACPPEQAACAPPPDIVPPAPVPAPAAVVPAEPAAQDPAPAAPPFLDSSTPADRNGAEVTNERDIIPVGFVTTAFELAWQRADRPVSAGRVARGWLWGPAARAVRNEPYREATNGQRQVLYFDKGRMELSDPRANVTSGLLVGELISGRIQLGDSTFTERAPAEIALVGDADDQRAPTYASLRGVLTASEDRTSQLPLVTIDRSGTIGSYGGPPRSETRLVRYVDQTGHNIPAVFWEYLTSRGTIYTNGYTNGQLFNWVTTVGYPISEPYWTRVRVGGVERDVLVQAFERRILSYTPDESAQWRVQFGNVGQHYYRWRYGSELP